MIRGERVDPLPIGFIIDSPWLPGWCGMAIADYLSSGNLWFEANRRVIETFPECMFLVTWHKLQRETIPTIDGILILDDIVGFIGEKDFLEFGFPYFKDLYAADVAVKFFHNDAPCAASIRHYADIGIQLFNPGIQNTVDELKEMCGNRLTLLHGIPPRDVLALGTSADVSAAVRRLLAPYRIYPDLLAFSRSHFNFFPGWPPL